jgi:hypothetical protein
MRRGVVVGAGERLGAVETETRRPPLEHPPWMREPDRETVERVADALVRRCRPVAKRLPKRGVDERRGPPAPSVLHELDRLVDGGVLGHALEVAELVEAEPERDPHRQVELLGRAIGGQVDQVVELASPP